MKTEGNTILITGGGTGIGLGLAKEFRSLGNQVIIAGRRRDVLDDAVKGNPGMTSYVVDLRNPDEIMSFSGKVLNDFPNLNVLINNAGVMKTENLLDERDWTDMDATVATNFLGPLRLTTALLPSLLKQPRAAIVNVTSGLGFVPMATAPTYCATKAALHSYTESLRHQLKKTRVEVVELIPPYVATRLMDGTEAPGAMPLDSYIAEAMEILKSEPNTTEVCVENVKRLRLAAEAITYEMLFRSINSGR
jgi:uncharacterized oxidoreductase